MCFGFQTTISLRGVKIFVSWRVAGYAVNSFVVRESPGFSIFRRYQGGGVSSEANGPDVERRTPGPSRWSDPATRHMKTFFSLYPKRVNGVMWLGPVFVANSDKHYAHRGDVQFQVHQTPPRFGAMFESSFASENPGHPTLTNRKTRRFSNQI